MELAKTLILLFLVANIYMCQDEYEWGGSKIIFVNEVCRHGARAPEVKGYENEQFPNGNGMLTASGMRQHYLLGTQLNKRYVNSSPKGKSKLLSHEFNNEEIYIRSTQVLRTIQSAEVQMLGLYPLGSAKELDKDLVENAHPHINIHNEAEIIRKLGKNAIEDGYRPIPAHNFDVYVDDMVAYGFCPYMVNDYLQRDKDPEIWKPYDDYFRPLIYDQLAKAFNTTPDQLDFKSVGSLSDILWAEDFQGIQNRYNFTEEEFEIVKQIQLPSLVELLSDTSRSIMVSRMLNPVVEMMKSKIGLDYNQSLVQDFENSKFLLFSSHDYQLSQILKFLEPENLDYKYIDYASVILYELHQSKSVKCRVWLDKDCYFVRAYFNNDQMKLPGCKKLDCKFTEFEAYIKQIGMTYNQMQTKCYEDIDLTPQDFRDYHDSMVERQIISDI